MSSISSGTREEILERDDRECRFCGITNADHKEEQGRELSLHHIIKQKSGGSDDPENLITVCSSCHKTLESTQADALSRIANNEMKPDEKEELQEKVEDYKESAIYYQKRFEDLSDVYSACLNSMTHQNSVTVYAVHETRYVTSRLRYIGRDEEKAIEKFQECEHHATMETTEVMGVKPIELVDIDRVEHGTVADGFRDIKEELADGEMG